MAYSRKRARKYFRRVKRSFRKLRRSTGIAAPRSTRGFYGPGAKRRGKIHVELKKYDSFDTTQAMNGGTPTEYKFNLTATDNTDNSNVVSIFQPAVGSGFNQRIGRRVMVKSIAINMSLIPGGNSTGLAGVSRLVCMVDSQPNAATANPAVADMIGNGGTGPTNCNVFSGNNLDYRARFRTVMNKVVSHMSTIGESVAAAATAPRGFSASATSSELHCDFYKKVNFAVTFNGGTNGQKEDINTNKILLFAIGLRATPDHCTWTGSTRVRYIDP